MNTNMKYEKELNIFKRLTEVKTEKITYDFLNKFYLKKCKKAFIDINSGNFNRESKTDYKNLYNQQRNEFEKIKLEIEQFKDKNNTLVLEKKQLSEKIEKNIIKPLKLKSENDSKKIELYIEFEEKLQNAANLLSLDTNTPNWHRLISKTINDLKSSKKSLEIELEYNSEILNSINIENVYDEQAIKHIKIHIKTIEKIREKYNISEYEDIISSLDNIINNENSKMSDILSEKQKIKDNYQQKIDDISNTIEQYKNEILEPLQISDISKAPLLIKKYKEYSNFFGIAEFNDTLYSYQKLTELKEDIKYNNLFENITKTIENTETTGYMKNLIIYLKILDIDIKQFYDNIKEEPDIKTSMFDIKAIQITITKLENSKYLQEVLSINLHNLSKKAFFVKFLKPNLGLFIDLLSALYSYSNITYPNSVEIVKVFHQKPQLKQELHKIYNELQRFLSFEYDIQLKTVNVFIDSFDVSLHEMIEYSDVQKLPYYKEHIKKLSNGVIYDLNSVGISSVKLNINIKPKVVYKQ